MPLVACNSTTATAAVLAGDADLGFVEGHVDGDLLRVQHVGGDRLGLNAASGHPLVGHPMEAADLQRAAWVLREPGSSTREHQKVGVARHGLNLDVLTVRLVPPSNSTVLDAVGAGGLIATGPDLAASSRLATEQVVRLDYELPPRDFRVITHGARRASRAVAAFMQSLDRP